MIRLEAEVGTLLSTVAVVEPTTRLAAGGWVVADWGLLPEPPQPEIPAARQTANRVTLRFIKGPSGDMSPQNRSVLGNYVQ